MSKKIFFKIFVVFFSYLVGASFFIHATPQNKTTEIVQSLIDQSEEGATIEIPAGVYHGKLMINKSLKLDGHHQVTIDGDNKGTVVLVNANNVELKNIKIIHSGESHTDSDAALEITGRSHRVENLRIEDSFFGIKVKEVSQSVFQNNHIQSYKDKDISERGDSFFIWNSNDNLFSNNSASFSRDFSLNNSPNNKIINNKIEFSRTGFYLVFSKECEVSDNTVFNSSTGIALLYSPSVKIIKNVFVHNLDGNGSCISTKDSMNTLISENQLVHCSVGYLSDGPLGEDLIQVEKNLFAHNFLGIRIYGQKGSHRFIENVFSHNLVGIFLPLDGDASYMSWKRNFWDDYEGFGKEPYKNMIFADRIWMEIPQAKFFANSPFFEFIDFLEKLAPFSSPNLQLIDEEPQNRNSEVYKRFEKVLN